MSKPWPMVPLGEIFAERKEVPFPADIENGSIRIVSKIGFKEGKIELRSGAETKTGMILIHPGDLVVSGINAAKGAIAIYGEENTEPIAATIHYGAYIPNKDRVDVKFLWWLLRSRTFRELLLEYVPGGIKTELKAKRLLPIPIPLPPRSEQKRIVARIEELSAKIEEAKGLRQKAVEEEAALVASATDTACFKSGFPVSTLGNVLIEAKNGIYKPPFYWGQGIPCVRMYNIDGPTMNLYNLQLLDVTADELSMYGCKAGDLIFNRVNSAELVGKTGLITEEYPSCTFESKNMRLRVDSNNVLPRYVAIILNSTAIRDYYRMSLKQQCGMATLNQGHVKGIPLPLPSLPEQRRIVAYLDDLQAKSDALKHLQAETTAEIGAMMPSVLDRAFKGEL